MILVTGATGRIGNVLVKELVKKKYEVRILVRESSNLKSLEGINVDIAYGDVTKPETLNLAMKDIESVFHLAGKINISDQDKDGTYDINIQGTKNIIQACIESRVEELIYTSSIHAFLAPSDGSLITEKNQLCIDSGEQRGVYDCSKAFATKEILSANGKGLKTLILAPTGVVGPYDYRPSYFGLGMISSIKNDMKYTIDGAYDYVDVRDVVQGIVSAYEKQKFGEIYLLGGFKLEMKDYFEYLKEITKVKGKTIFLSRQLAILLGRIMLLFDKQSPITPYSVRTLDSNSNVDHSKATRELDYHPMNMKESIKDQYEWFKSNGYIS